TTLDRRELVGCFIEAPDFLEACPDRIALLVPGELVAIDEAARRERADDDPGQEAVARGEAQVARRFPAAAAHVVEGELGILTELGRLRLRAAEVERGRRRH